MTLEQFIKEHKISHAMLYPKLGISPSVFSLKLNHTGNRYSFSEEERKILIGSLKDYGGGILDYLESLP